MSCQFENRNGIGVAKLIGGLTAANAESTRDQFIQWLATAADIRHLVVDLGECDTLDSSGLGALIAMLKRISERGGDLKLARLQKKTRLVIEITRAYKIFEIFETVEEALAACA